MNDVRQVRLFRNGRNQALRIPREFELPGTVATVCKVGVRLIVEPVQRRSLLATLAALSPLPPEDGFPDVDEQTLPLDDPIADQ